MTNLDVKRVLSSNNCQFKICKYVLFKQFYHRLADEPEIGYHWPIYTHDNCKMEAEARESLKLCGCINFLIPPLGMYYYSNIGINIGHKKYLLLPIFWYIYARHNVLF